MSWDIQTLSPSWLRLFQLESWLLKSVRNTNHNPRLVVNGSSSYDVIYSMIVKYWYISHHFCAICILVRCPAASISWVRQLEGCSPFITISISLSSKSTHFHRFTKINLQPIVIPAGFFGTPAIAPVTIESTIPRLVTSAILRGRSHLIVGNFGLVWNSYRLRIAVIFYSWNLNFHLELLKVIYSIVKKINSFSTRLALFVFLIYSSESYFSIGNSLALVSV